MAAPDSAPAVAGGSRNPGAASALSPTERNRLRWRCRRGMLENDLVLTRFLDQRGADLTRAEVAALDRLLDLADDELWNLLCGRAAPPDAALAPLVSTLRNVRPPSAINTPDAEAGT